MNNRLREIARETVEIAERGTYGDVDLRNAVTDMIAGTRYYGPDDPLDPPGRTGTPVITVTNETTLEAARRLAPDVASLNFASARNPGGGFLRGTVAQEESLAYASALYLSLREEREFYGHHADPLYSDRVIYSPAVPVFRDDDANLLATPYTTAFLTAAAPNRTVLARDRPEHLPEIPAVLTRRAQRVLAIAAAHGHRRLVLGAWGCGVFGNDPEVVTTAFETALGECPWFDEIVFAVLDTRPGAPTYQAFSRLNQSSVAATPSATDVTRSDPNAAR